MKKQEKIVFQQILVSFRAATCEDVNLLFRWVNNPEVRKNAFSQRKIGYSEHQRWFDKKLGNECSKIFIFTLGSQPVGQVRFEINRDGTAEIDVSIDRDYRGKGLAGNILHIASEFAVTQLGISTIFTHIKLAFFLIISS